MSGKLLRNGTQYDKTFYKFKDEFYLFVNFWEVIESVCTEYFSEY